MADSPAHTDEGDDTAVGHDSQPASGTPLWVKVFGIITLVVLLVLVVLLLAGGNHGPGRHSSGGTGDALPSSVTKGPGLPSGAGHGGQPS